MRRKSHTRSRALRHRLTNRTAQPPREAPPQPTNDDWIKVRPILVRRFKYARLLAALETLYIRYLAVAGMLYIWAPAWVMWPVGIIAILSVIAIELIRYRRDAGLSWMWLTASVLQAVGILGLLLKPLF